MNMQGIIAPIDDDLDLRGSHVRRVRDWLWRRRMFGLIVVLPTLLVAAYLFLIASDQYESEAHFLVRSANVAEAPATGVSQVVSMVTGGSSGQNEAMSVADYLTSHDAVAALEQQQHLVQRFNRPDADLLSRLRSSHPTPEKVLKYFRKQASVTYNTENGITTLQVHSFTPQDSYELVKAMLALGEQRVNLLNTRSYNDAIATARRQLQEAEDALATAQLRMTQFRQNRGDIDPQATGQAQINLVTNLTAQLAASRAQLNAMGNMINHSSPQYIALAARVRALESQVGAQSGRLTGSGTAIAARIGGYEDLQIRQQFLAKRYEAAAASFDRAREQALRQQLYLVRVVEPNMPVKALFPERWRILATVVIALFLVYSIGWLIVAGVREHAS